MNEVEILRKLAASASREAVPPVEVSSRVFADLVRPNEDMSRPLVWVAAVSGALAAPMAALALLTLDAWGNPMVELMWFLDWMLL